MCSIHEPETMKKLHISLHESVGENDVTSMEFQVLLKYAHLCIEISSARCWSQCQYTVTLPNLFASIHHSSDVERVRGIGMVKKIWEAVLKAEKLVQDDSVDADVRDCLQQTLNAMAWHKGQVAREMYLVCQAGNWDVHDQQMRQLGFLLFGTPANTKHFLEDTFSHLADLAKRAIRNIKMTKNLAFKCTFLIFDIRDYQSLLLAF